MLAERVEASGLKETTECCWPRGDTHSTGTPPGTYGDGRARRRGSETSRCTTFRHFYASGLIADGCDVVTVQDALGHSDASTTLRVYAHLWPKAEDRTRAAAAELMRVALADSVRLWRLHKPLTWENMPSHR